jgi:hypothetical protein
MAEEKKKTDKRKDLEKRVERLEKQLKTNWKQQLWTGIITGLVVLVLGGLYSTILLPRVEKWITAQSMKPNTDRCAIVYLKDDPYSKEIADITKKVLESKSIKPLRRYRIIAEDSNWYGSYYTGDALVNKSIELSYNDPINTWLVDASRSPKPAPVERTLKYAIFRDSTGVRDNSLPLSRPELKWMLEDVRSRGQMPPEAGLTPFAITVVSPPSSWWVKSK